MSTPDTLLLFAAKLALVSLVWLGVVFFAIVLVDLWRRWL